LEEDMTRADGATATGGVHRHRGRTPAQWYCTIAGLALTLAGILGFLADSSFDLGGRSDGDATGNADGALQGDGFLGFEVNGWHNVIHLLSGIFLLAMARRRRTAKTAAIAFGVVYGLVAIIGLIDGNDVLGIIPVNPADNILHIALSALGLITGLISDKDDWDKEQRTMGGKAGHKVADRSAPAVGAEERGGRFGRTGEPVSGERVTGERTGERVTNREVVAGPDDGRSGRRRRDENLRNR